MLVEMTDDEYKIYSAVKEEKIGIVHGAIYLQIHFRDTRIQYFKTNREKSISVTPLDRKASGEIENSRTYSSGHSKMSKGMKK